MTVGIIGGRSTGKTVFVSLLATTAINYSVETKYHFRYWTSPEFTPVIQDSIASLKLKKWPPATLKGSLAEYKFWFAYSRKFSGILISLINEVEKLSAFIKRLDIPRKELYNIIEFRLYDLPGEDVDTLLKTGPSIAKERGISVIDTLSENLKKVLDCNVLVFLIDSSRISTDNTDPKYKEMLDYDGLMATLMSLVAEYRSRKYGSKAGKLFPVFVFTKFDTVDRKVLNDIGISENIEGWFIEKSKERKDIAERLFKFMKRFYRHTLALAKGGTVIKGVPLEKAEIFVSYLMPELSEEGIPVPRVKKVDEISYELVYSMSEYFRFIDYFGTIADDIKKEQKIISESVTGLGR